MQKTSTALALNNSKSFIKKQHYKNLFEFAFDPTSGKILGGEKMTEKIKKTPPKIKVPDNQNFHLSDEVLNLNEQIKNQIPLSFKKQEVNFMVDKEEDNKSSFRSPPKKGEAAQPSEGFIIFSFK